MRDAPAVVGTEFDYLVKASPENLARRAFSESGKSAVVGLMRNEGPSILEWVAHHRLLGFGQIFIYSNDNDDGSDELLLALHYAGVVRLLWNTATSPSLQVKAYRHALCCLEELEDFEWAAVIDADEFLIPVMGGSVVPIDRYVADLKRRDCSGISLNWHWFAGRAEFERTSGLLFERYRESSPNTTVKSMFRLGDALDIGTHSPHLRSGARLINATGSERAQTHLEDPPVCELGQVNHYWNKSFQEFFVKRQRGRSSNREARDWDSFFKWRRRVTIDDPRPDAAHIKKVKAEIDILRKLPGVTRAEADIDIRLTERLAAREVREIFDAARASCRR